MQVRDISFSGYLLSTQRVSFLLFKGIAFSAFLSLTTAFFSVANASQVIPIVPENGVVLKSTKQLPWMATWQRGREYVRQGELVLAKKEYQKLFKEKPHIEEAFREYVLILMGLKQWQAGTPVIQQLLELDPASLEYQLYAGRIALQQHRYAQAAKYLGQLYTLSPDGKYSIESLQGLVLSLQKLHKMELVYPLMEQLYLRVPHNPEAIRRLAQYSEKLGYKAKACDYFQTLLLEFSAEDKDYLMASRLFEESGNMAMAVQCWQGYLKKHSYYLPFHKKLSDYYLSNGLDRSALSHLLVQVALNDKRPEILLKIGQIYLYQEGRPDKALYYYEEYRKQRPDDEKVLADVKRIQTVLAGDFLAIVENDGAWSLWRDLKEITPDRLAIYAKMAVKLEETGKMKELLQVLQIIHIHDPENQEIIFRLAQLYFVDGDLTESAGMLDVLSDLEKQGKDYFYLRARIEEEKGELLQALQYYKKYIEVNPTDSGVLLECLNVSGKAGLMQELSSFYTFLHKYFSDSEILEKGDRLYGEALVQNGLPSTGLKFYKSIAAKRRSKQPSDIYYRQKNIQALQGEKKYFQAETELRELLNQVERRQEVVLQLIDNNLQAGDSETAWGWYDVLVRLSGGSSDICDSVDVQLFTEKMVILRSSEEFDNAIDQLEDFLLDYQESCPEQERSFLELIGKLAQFYHQNGEYSDAKELFSKYPKLSKISTKLQILEQYLVDVATGDESLQHLVGFLKEQGGDFSLNLLTAAGILKDYGNYQSALRLVRKHLQLVPDSIRGKILQAELYVKTQETFAALPIYKELAAMYPDEDSFERIVLQLQFQQAQFTTIINKLAPYWKINRLSEPFETKPIDPRIISMEPWKQLLLARALWAVRRWDDSLQLYEELLCVPVDQQFAKRIFDQKKELVLPPPQKTFWNSVTFTNPAEPDRLRTAMSPEFTTNYFDKSVVSIAIGLYEKFRFQGVVSSELSVRKAMQEGNYYQAMKEYQKLVVNGSSPENMFDLAGIYSQLGFLGKEAALYEKMAVDSPGYPNLDEAMQRNVLKRTPRVAVTTSGMKKSGRNGYYDNDQWAGGIEGWFMPSLRHEVDISYQRLNNRSIEHEDEIYRSRFFANMKWSPLYDLDVTFGGGVDSTDNTPGSTFLYTVLLNGRVGDMVQAHIGIHRDVVDDTVDALMEQLYMSEYEAGVKLDFLPRLFGGAQYFFTEYSDGNHQNRYDIWTSYTLHSEPTLLTVRYGYEYSHNSDLNRGGGPAGNVVSPVQDYPYWSPKEYWEHLFTVSFEHQLGDDILGRGAPSYYSLEYSFGYELDGYVNHEVKANIYLEISRHFLLNSKFEYTDGAEFENRDVQLSLIYRW